MITDDVFKMWDLDQKRPNPYFVYLDSCHNLVQVQSGVKRQKILVEDAKFDAVLKCIL